jgi:DNA-binding transcriptional LysR family regulator
MADLNSLTIFAKVVEANSFSEAARRLNMPTSSVSRRVADLEDQLGVRLLERSTRSLRLTDVGSEVLEHAQRSADSAMRSTTSSRALCRNVSGKLLLSALPSISDSLVAPLVGGFRASYPNVPVSIFVTKRFVWSSSGTGTSCDRCVYSRNSRCKWRRSSFQRFRLDKAAAMAQILKH